MVRKRVITLGIVLGLMVNWIIIQAEQAKSADNYVIPQYIMDDMQKNVGYNNKTVNNYESQRNQQPQQVVTMDRNLYNQPQPIQYSSQVTIDQNVYRQPTQTQNNNYYQYQQVNNYDPNRPEWSEFCPFGRENAEKDTKKYQTIYGKVKGRRNNYWYERKQDFEKQLAFCDSQQTNRDACYTKLRARQYRLNNDLKAADEQEAILQTQQQMAQQQYYLQQQQIQANQQIADREYKLRQQEMLMKNYVRPPQIESTKYRFYNQYGQPTGYVQQTNW